MKNLNNTNKGSKVGPRAVPLPITMDAAKRLRTMALTCEAPTSAWQGVLAGLNKFEAFLAATRAREGSDEVLATIAPLTAATALAKRAIRRRHGLTITPVMQEMLREILSWHARTCGEALVGGIFQSVDGDDGTATKMTKTTAEVRQQEHSLLEMIRAGTMQRADSSSSTARSTLPASSRSRASSVSSTLSIASLNGHQFWGATRRGAAFYPRAEPCISFLTRVAANSLAARLPGRAAIREWCSGVIAGFVSRARSWM